MLNQMAPLWVGMPKRLLNFAVTAKQVPLGNNKFCSSLMMSNPCV